MYEKTIKYTDYNGEERTEKFNFNVTKAELIKMELGTVGGFGEFCQRIINARDIPEIARVFEEIIKMSYGVKSPDGRSFVKSPELTKSFMETEAYSELYLELLSDAHALAEFIKHIVPKDIANGLTEDENGMLIVKDNNA